MWRHYLMSMFAASSYCSAATASVDRLRNTVCVSYTICMYLIVLIGSVLVLLYFLTLAGTILASKALLPAALVPILSVLQFIFGFLYGLLTDFFVFVLSFF